MATADCIKAMVEENELTQTSCSVRFKSGEENVELYVPLQERIKTLQKELKEKLRLANIMSVPRLVMVTVNRGIGDVSDDKHKVDVMFSELSNIACQKAVVVKARKSISNFKLREGNKVGVKVTLRRKRMYSFLDRLINIVLPRIRDFRGISIKGFDRTGVYNLGIQDQTVFPEIRIDDVVASIGMNITFKTTSKVKKHNIALFEALGFRFKKQ